MGRAYGNRDEPPRKRRARRPELGTARWQKLRKAILVRDLHTCHWCGRPANTADHVLPASHGGDLWDPANIVAACQLCNRARPTDAYSGPERTVTVHSRTAYSARTSVLSEDGWLLDAASRHLPPPHHKMLGSRKPTTTTGSGRRSPRVSAKVPTITGDYTKRVHTGPHKRRVR
ncbi:MAG: HNH endonuclease [Deltaproteobacteria bacterium]